jgi:Uma2 family endonuclease
MNLSIPKNPLRLSTGVFTDHELDYFDTLGPDYFPSEETQKVSESDAHYLSIKLAFELLERVFPEPSDVYIAANHFIYWDRRQKGLVLGPDLYVAKGVGRRRRDSYKVWEEGGQVPNVVFEFASDETWKKDLREKKDYYERDLTIPEYFLFDPVGGRYPRKLQGFRLEGGTYRPIPLTDDRLYSEQLDLNLVSDGIYLRFFDPHKGALVPSPAEDLEARTRMEAENARLRAELEALRRNVQP